MQNYLDLVQDVLDNGIDKTDRTGIGSRSVFGRQLRFNLQEEFPLVTERFVPFRLVFEETMFFLRGETNTKILEEKNVNIWKGNTSREFLDNRGLEHLPEGDMGKGYGYQWRKFGGTALVRDEDNDITQYGYDGVDQIADLVEGLQTDPYSRRHLVSAWNPIQLPEMALPPCHIMHQYQVMDGKLNSLFYMRSNDVYLGLPFNIASYAFLNMAFANIVGLEPGELVYTGGDVHLYSNQIEASEMLVQRRPFSSPRLSFKKQVSTLDELLALEYDDLELYYEYNKEPLPKVEMAI